MTNTEIFPSTIFVIKTTHMQIYDLQFKMNGYARNFQLLCIRVLLQILLVTRSIKLRRLSFKVTCAMHIVSFCDHLLFVVRPSNFVLNNISSLTTGPNCPKFGGNVYCINCYQSCLKKLVLSRTLVAMVRQRQKMKSSSPKPQSQELWYFVTCITQNFSTKIV